MGIAIVIVIIAVLSGVSLSSVAFMDTHSFRQQLDGLQQFHFLRSEVGRGRLLASHIETMEHPSQHTVLPLRLMNVEFGSHRTLYKARTKMDLLDSGESGEGFLIRSLITAVRGRDDTTNPDYQSPVKRYGENVIRSLQTLAIFHYFSDIDRERDDVPGNIRFFQGDIIHGRVHSNTDIYMRSGSWPEFHGLVTTAGVIRVYPGGGTNFPEEEIFFGGLIENYYRVRFDATADYVRRNAQNPLGTVERDDQIAYVTVDGAAFVIWVGTVQESYGPPWIEGKNQFTIYNSYPPYGPVGDEIGVNRIAEVDTMWTSATGGTVRDGQSVFIPMELWISGTFKGRQTWGSSHDIYLKGDLLYEHTDRGEPPDGVDEDGEQTLVVNHYDYLGIISEESIIIQYGHKDPRDSVRYRPNTDDIYMYGAYCAVGEADEPWNDGIFTFQYQFPKGSTPAQWWRGEWFKNIDLHLFSYPTSVQEPWPLGMDYPWYNPLWPEPGPLYGLGPDFTPNPHNAPTVVQLRGAIHLFGSVAQRRRGYVRRSGGTDFDTGLWDVENVIEPDTPPRYGAPPPSIGPSGYDKRYTYDTRFDVTGPPDFPLVIFEGYETMDLMDLGHATISWVFKTPPSNF